ncbi:TsoY family (seleno)protein [Pseudorhodobacter aquimaris]|uniref:TsoY family (seleno)protein n=1 Tax=Pseudorhodobacter aquimaris TaxID=687412 RepID=UPI00067BFD2C|nr:hypothetical protein [Pseudorhodobacter aquimaris]
MAKAVQNRPADNWGPQYFLASVGAGGLVVTFFMWLYMWIPHPGQPVPVFEDVALAFANGGALQQAMILIAALGVAIFAVLNLKMLFWNIGRLNRFKKTDGYSKLIGTNAQSQLTALPLAIAMTVNVGFILGLVFVPGLWGVVEYLFPLAMIAFALTAWLAFAQIGSFVAQVLTPGRFKFAANNSFGQVLPAFALSMIGVGFSAPAALSASPLTAGVALIASTLLLVMAALWALIAVVLGIASILQNGTNIETAPTLLIIVPLMTVLGILMLRQGHGLHVHFGAHETAGGALRMLTAFLSVQVAFGLFGLTVLRAQGYGARFLTGAEPSVGSYALVCPGIALSVMMQFWINNGLVGAGLVVKFGVGYWVLSAIAVGFQVSMILLVLTLNRRHFRAPQGKAAMPAQ